ncbi:hypothetical protein diail_387 [Diaporthe ilicicola]|nr:hypothetical protein diail_387 [Diaporthe ilicicola]
MNFDNFAQALSRTACREAGVRDETLVKQRPAGHMGDGLFATKDMPAGTRILSELPYLMIPGEPTQAMLAENVASFCQATTRPDVLVVVRLIDMLHVQDAEHLEPTVDAMRLVEDWFQSNADITEDESFDSIICSYTTRFWDFMRHATRLPRQNAMGIFYRYSSVNHSCSPNAYSYYDHTTHRLRVHLARDVKTGDQIFVSYTSSEALPRADRRAELSLQGHRFICSCPLCTNDQADATMQRIFTSIQTLSNFQVRIGAEVGQINPSFNTPTDSAEGLAIGRELVDLLQRRSIDLQGPKLKWTLRTCAENSRRLGYWDLAAVYAREELAMQVRLWGFETEHFGPNENAMTRLHEIEEERRSHRTEPKPGEIVRAVYGSP